MAYMIAAYGAIWLLTFAFIASIYLRQRRIQRDLAALEQMMLEGDQSNPQRG